MDNLNALGFSDMNEMTVRSVRPAPGTQLNLFDQDRSIMTYFGTLLGPFGSSYDDVRTECFNVPAEFTTEWLRVARISPVYNP